MAHNSRKKADGGNQGMLVVVFRKSYLLPVNPGGRSNWEMWNSAVCKGLQLRKVHKQRAKVVFAEQAE